MIGVFDSGFGGLTVLRDMVARLPQYSYVYLGDTARAPYGDRSDEETYEFAKQAVDFLFKEGCELIILACNTISGKALRKIQQEYLPTQYSGRNVLGVIVPTAEVAAHETKSGTIGVIGTKGTVASGAFIRELKKEKDSLNIVQHACPALVPLIEKGMHHTEETKQAIRECVAPTQEAGVDTLILGCTHYGVVEDEIARAVGDSIRLVSEGPIVAEKLERYLERHPDMESKIQRGGMVAFYTTGDTSRFEELGEQFYGTYFKADQVVLG